ncbi:MAG: VOC family protein [Gammaproteobacteria bacterium]|nr:glyoxalase [Gammaproteobacteria bacterium]
MSENRFTPAVIYRDPKAAIEWLERAFGFERTMLITSPDEERVLHAEMSLGGRGRIMIAGEWSERTRSPKAAGLNTQLVHVELDRDIDAHCDRARKAGGVIVQEPEDQFYGARTYRVLDPEGHVWTFSQSVRTVSRAEAEKAIGAKIYAKDWA